MVCVYLQNVFTGGHSLIETYFYIPPVYYCFSHCFCRMSKYFALFGLEEVESSWFLNLHSLWQLCCSKISKIFWTSANDIGKQNISALFHYLLSMVMWFSFSTNVSATTSSSSNSITERHQTTIQHMVRQPFRQQLRKRTGAFLLPLRLPYKLAAATCALQKSLFSHSNLRRMQSFPQYSQSSAQHHSDLNYLCPKCSWRVTPNISFVVHLINTAWLTNIHYLDRTPVNAFRGVLPRLHALTFSNNVSSFCAFETRGNKINAQKMFAIYLWQRFLDQLIIRFHFSDLRPDCWINKRDRSLILCCKSRPRNLPVAGYRNNSPLLTYPPGRQEHKQCTKASLEPSVPTVSKWLIVRRKPLSCQTTILDTETVILNHLRRYNSITHKRLHQIITAPTELNVDARF